MRFLFIISIIGFFLFTIPKTHIHAAKLRVKKTVAKTVPTALASYSSAKLSRPTNSIILSLKNLSRVKTITYELSYATNGIDQGAMGTIAIVGQSTDTRDLYFGTCSRGACSPHYNITNATLLVKTELSTGGTNSKRYNIKI